MEFAHARPIKRPLIDTRMAARCSVQVGNNFIRKETSKKLRSPVWGLGDVTGM